MYGTLKRGFVAHERLCENAETSEARVRGELYELPQGYPALVVEEANILARATKDPAYDAAVQTAIRPAPLPPGSKVYGEVIGLDNPLLILPIDEYEGCIPGGDGDYDRVIVAASTDSGTVAAWTYVVRSPSGRYLEGGIWPGNEDEEG